MSAADRRELGRYVRWIADEIGLRDWTFTILHTDDMDEGGMDYDDDDGKVVALGSCSPTPGQRKAVIKLSPKLRDEPRDLVREIVTHELVHCHFADLYEHARVGTLKHLGQSTYDAFMFGYSQAWEHAVDAIAHSWATKMPLITWPEQ